VDYVIQLLFKQWHNDEVAAASSDGGPTGRLTKREKARGGPNLRK